jgi:hypothetical protein
MVKTHTHVMSWLFKLEFRSPVGASSETGALHSWMRDLRRRFGIQFPLRVLKELGQLYPASITKSKLK